MATAWAVVKDAEINIRTVGDTERMAKVNGLCVIGKVMPRQSWTDADIDRAWGVVAFDHGCKIERVNVTFDH
jgi:hypothetical protein